MNIHTGTSGWSYEQWVGSFYPEITRPSRYLEYYSSLFDTVEIDSTFYYPPEEKTIRKWTSQTPDNFKFCPKMFRKITHDLKLIGTQNEVDSFMNRIRIFGKKLGITLIQLPPSLSFRDINLLKDFVEILPENYNFAMEFRDESWFNPQVYSLLEKNHIILAWSDIPYAKKHSVKTAETIYLRLVGDRSISEDKFGSVRVNRNSELEWWSLKLKEMTRENEHTFVFANNHYQGFGPGTLNLLRNKLGMREIDFGPMGSAKRQSHLF